ncbi:MAG: hypothetical protein U9Q15_00955 [Patescibacteria group bacterium]|nr:hypothetical protein [Patescibacteria group bacterium]
MNKIRKSLEDQQSRYQLIVVYGYRSLEAQTKYFNNYLEEVKKKYPDISNIDQLREIAHR